MEDHHHNHNKVRIDSLGGIYVFSIVLNLTFVAVETAMGIIGDSLGLLSDAGHNLGDVFSLLLALIAFKLARSKSSKRFTYGYRKSSILISLLNAIILLIAVGAILIESIHKFTDPGSGDTNGLLVSWTAGVGILINGLTAWLLSKQSGHDINTRGAFLHMLADTLVSVGVLVSGVVIHLTGWTFIDPAVGIAIALIILTGTCKLLSESFKMSIDAVPEGIEIDEISALIKKQEGVCDAHHLHIWPISTTENALTAHVVLEDASASVSARNKIKKALAEAGITHATLEIEEKGSLCSEQTCDCGN